MDALVVYYWESSTESGFDDKVVRFKGDKPSFDELTKFMKECRYNHNRYLSVRVVNVIPLA